jgi:hypothetical protein
LSVTESLRIPFVSQHVSLTQITCSVLSKASPSSFASNMISAPSRTVDQYWRWPALTPDEAEELRGMKVLRWQDESWAYPNEKGSPWAAIPRQPIEPHMHDVPLHMWFSQRGMDFHPDLDQQSVWWQPSHTYDDVVGEVIVYKKLPCSPEKWKRISDALQDIGNEKIAYHGCPVYAVASIARNGFLASDNAERGHQALEGKRWSSHRSFCFP